MRKSPLERCHLIDFPVINDRRGDLTFIEGQRHIPFLIKRVYYLYNVPTDSNRGGHAHKNLEQVIICISGSFEIHINDGNADKKFILNQASNGLYLCPMIWREIRNFTPNTVCLVLASDFFDESDYYRCYDDFLLNVESKK
jgi:dTDP-4-dehydrorhamnose 3,5-epimerase-like enzyme